MDEVGDHDIRRRENLDFEVHQDSIPNGRLSGRRCHTEVAADDNGCQESADQEPWGH